METRSKNKYGRFFCWGRASSDAKGDAVYTIKELAPATSRPRLLSKQEELLQQMAATQRSLAAILTKIEMNETKQRRNLEMISSYVSLLFLGFMINYKAGGVKAQDWRADGHRWVNQGTVGLPRKCPIIKKKYFYIATENGASKEFVKFVFHEPGKDSGPFLIQYVGNEQISQPHAHGNSKDINKPFVRTKPSALDKWLKKTKAEDPHEVYKQEIYEDEMSSLTRNHVVLQ